MDEDPIDTASQDGPRELGVAATALRRLLGNSNGQIVVIRPAAASRPGGDLPQRDSLDLFSQMRAVLADTCPTHEGCDGSCREGQNIATPILTGQATSTVERKRPRPAVTNGRTLPLTLGDTLAVYEYTRLAPSEIRLLRVHKALFRADAVVCELVVCSIQDAPKYAALSYCWGNGSDDCRVLLIPGGRVFMARRTLEAALKRFRAAADSDPLYDREEYIWADAICINQNDYIEKMEQLAMMQDIYKKAEAVYIDLGDAPPEWYSAYSLMNRAAMAVEAPEASRGLAGLPATDHVSYVHYWRTFSKPWFTRTWVVQEYVFAKRIMAMHGHSVFWWHELEMSFQLLFREFSSVPFSRYKISAAEQKQIVAGTGNYRCLQAVRERVRTGRRSSPQFLELTRALHVTKSKDKIFALLSLFPEDEANDFDDYSLPAYELFIRYAVGQVKRGRACEMLNYAGLQRRRGKVGEMPSWVPDWTFSPIQNGPRRFARHREQPYSASGNLEDGLVSIRENCLLLSCFFVDTLMAVQPAAIINLDRARPRSYYNRQGIKKARWATEWYRGVCTSAYKDPDRAFASLLLHSDVDMQGENSEGPSSYDPLETYEEFMNLSEKELQKINSRTSASHLWRYMQGVRDCTGLKFCITKRGYMALVPLVAIEGDRICILPGQEVPFLLRTEEKGKGFLLVGDAYVHGIMAGESLAFEGVSESDIILL